MYSSEAHLNWKPSEDTARCIGVFSHLRHFPSCPWVSVYHDLVRMRICYKAIDTSVISCPSTFLPLPLCYDMGIEFWSLIPWAMSGWHFAWWQMGYGHGSCTVSTKSENLNLMWKGGNGRQRREGRKAEEECERAKAHIFPPLSLVSPFSVC